VHALTAPLIGALQGARGGGAAKAGDAVAELLRRALTGLKRNPSLTGPYVMLYAHELRFRNYDFTTNPPMY
jgi:hypothetical protein